jgi:hypothetical protein
MIIYCTEEGTRTPTLKADAPKASVSTIPPPRQLFSPTFQRSFVFQHHKDMANF